MTFLKASVEDIEIVLADMRKAIDNKKYSIYPREEYKDTLSRLGIMPADALAEIYSLTCDDYYQGPETDRNKPHSDKLWMFRKNIFCSLVYIKFKILYQKDGRLIIISFHISNIY